MPRINETMPKLDEIICKLRYSKLSGNVVGYEKLKDALKWDDGKLGALKAAAEFAGETVAKQAASKAVGLAYTTKVVSTGLVAGAAVATFSSLGAVLAVWIGAAQVAHSCKQAFNLWDLADRGGGGGLYKCSCGGSCGEYAYHLANQHDIKQAKFAASLFVIPALAFGPMAIYDKFLNKSLSKKKLEMASALQRSAMPFATLDLAGLPVVTRGGCHKAQAIIATLFQEHGSYYIKTIASIMSIDGAKAIAGKIYD